MLQRIPVVERIIERRRGAVAVRCDVSREEDVRNMIGTAEQKFGRLDILVNNAGFGGGMKPLHEQTTEAWDRVHGTNIRWARLRSGITPPPCTARCHPPLPFRVGLPWVNRAKRLLSAAEVDWLTRSVFRLAHWHPVW